MSFCVIVRFGNLECCNCCCLWERCFYHLQVGDLDADRLNNLCSCSLHEPGSCLWTNGYGAVIFILKKVSASGTRTTNKIEHDLATFGYVEIGCLPIISPINISAVIYLQVSFYSKNLSTNICKTDILSNS